MRESITLLGMVLTAAPSGDYDRRLVLLTTERGKITAFAHGARRQGSSLMACSRTFVFGRFTLYEGRSAYNRQSAQVINYFEELSADIEGACYGSYFLELAGLCSGENEDATELLKLVYQSLRALLKPAIPNSLVRRIFELKTMVIGGEYTQLPEEKVSDSCAYAWEYVVCTPVEELYRFVLKEPVEQEFARCVDRARKRFLPRQCKSLEILETLTG